MICATASGSELSESSFGNFVMACGGHNFDHCVLSGPAPAGIYCYSQQLKLKGPGEQEAKLDLISKGEEPREGKKESGVSACNSQPSHKSHSIQTILKCILVLVLYASSSQSPLGCFPVSLLRSSLTLQVLAPGDTTLLPRPVFLTFNAFDWLSQSLTAISMWSGQDIC